MGIRGSATCELNFENAIGYLIGRENEGLYAMFTLMNMERITVGLQGLGLTEIAYQNALAYAKERLQGKAPVPAPDESKAADPIVFHPEIKRQLLKIRSQVEGGTLALLTPVIKSAGNGCLTPGYHPGRRFSGFFRCG